LDENCDEVLLTLLRPNISEKISVTIGPYKASELMNPVAAIVKNVAQHMHLLLVHTFGDICELKTAVVVHVLFRHNAASN
jgi:hypothetical protein